MIIQMEQFQTIIQKIDDMVKTHNLDYIDAALWYCEKNSLEIEMVGELIARNPIMKEKISLEAEDLHFIKKEARLPITT